MNSFSSRDDNQNEFSAFNSLEKDFRSDFGNSAALQKNDSNDSTNYIKHLANTMTTIAKGTEIVGNVKCCEDVIVDGIVNGDVTARNAEIGGCIKGTVKCEVAELFKGRVEGNINCDGDINVGSSFVVVGDIEANNITIDGNVKGRVVSKGSLKISKDACQIGEITSNELSIEESAKVVGNIKITSASIDMSDFDNI